MSTSTSDMKNKPSLLHTLLLEQRELPPANPSAVDSFSEMHENDKIHPQEEIYRSLMPTSAPEKGEQYSFEVNLDRCSGCKSCVTACHSMNGLDVDETWRQTGLLEGSIDGTPFLQTVTSSCHHCLDPACSNGCPVLAYEKDPITGIVKHLDDQCIGCQYCILKCPYDVPKYNKNLGIVRKCDMCSDRLAHGEAPACVQACPTEAITIRILRTEEVRNTSRGFLPGTIDPDYTNPTTAYVGKREIPADAVPGDAMHYLPQASHTPLVMMLNLTQFSVGAYIATALFEFSDLLTPFSKLVLYGIACTLGLAGLSASIFHLGRPLFFFKAVLGFRTSWISREALVFGAFAAAAQVHLILKSLSFLKSATFLPTDLQLYLANFPDLSALEYPTLAATLASGAAGLFCSVMIYADTRRKLWRLPATLLRFTTSTLGVGVGSIVVAFVFLHPSEYPYNNITFTIITSAWVLSGLVGILLEFTLLRYAKRSQDSLHRSAILMLGLLRKQWLLRLAFTFAGSCILPFFPIFLEVLAPAKTGVSVDLVLSTALILTLAGTMLERLLFFRLVDTPKMPGGLA